MKKATRKAMKHCMCGCIYLEAECPNCNKVTDADRIEELEAKLAKAVRERDEALNQLFIAQGSRTERTRR
jgi:hypothetical protein